jgi:acyl-ACP thioesterase
MWAERRTSIASQGPGEVEVVSLWVHLDPVSGQPTPLSKPELAVWGESAAGRRVTARLRHPAPESGADGFPWRFRATECDLAGHINNAAYLQPLEEELLLTAADLASIDLEIEYRSPSQPGDVLVLRAGARRWIIEPDGETYASLLIVNSSQED